MYKEGYKHIASNNIVYIHPLTSKVCFFYLRNITLCYMSKHTCGQVPVFPNRCLVRLAADDDLIILES